MQPYSELVSKVYYHGEKKSDRTGTGTRSIFGHSTTYDLQKGFPLVTGKFTFWKGVVEELLWFIRGETNVKSLQAKGVHIWDAWADEDGELGPVYGFSWRNWEGPESYIDQLAGLVTSLIESPDSRRHILSAWNVGVLHEMALPPCHLLTQFHVSASGQLNCQLYQRSADVMLGVPFNIASYALLTHIMAALTGLQVGKFTHVLGDAHIYENHLQGAHQYLLNIRHELPRIRLPEIPRGLEGLKRVEALTSDDFELIGYQHSGKIKFPVAV